MHPDTRVVELPGSTACEGKPPPKGSAAAEQFWRQHAIDLAEVLYDVRVRLAAAKESASLLEGQLDGRDVSLVKRICLTFAAGLVIGFLLGVLAR